MTRKDHDPAGREEQAAAGISGRNRDLRELDRRSHGGTQNGSTESARERWLSDVGDGDTHERQVNGPTDK